MLQPGFANRHATMLCQYGGISFIAGAVNHGFFSGARSLLTAAIGVALYVLGAWLERRADPAAARRWADLLGAGIVLSTGLGLFTGGLQHFPDSPTRSAWVVPLGFVLSAWALWRTEGSTWPRGPALRYGVASSALVALVCAGAWVGIGGAGPGHHDHHGHGHADGTAPGHVATAGAPGAARATGAPAPDAGPAAAERVVQVRMDDTMRFSPGAFHARAGETVLLRVTNAGRLPHEIVLGDQKALAQHRREMRAVAAAMTAHRHGDDHSHTHHAKAGAGAASNSGSARWLHLAPGASADLRYTFGEAGTVAFACFEPGHYEAGMHGRVDVMAAERPRRAS